jgi:subtilisin family serine protease
MFKKIMSTALIFVLICTALPNFALAEGTAAEEEEYDGFLVGISQDMLPPSAESGLEYVAKGVYKADYPEDILKNTDTSLIEYVEPNYYVELLAEDNLYDTALLNQIYQSGGAYGQMKVSGGGLDGDGVRIAVIDNGVNIDYGDFLPYKMICTTVFDDGITYDATLDKPYHATMVAAIINGIHDNNIGVNGIAPSAEIVSIKVFKKNSNNETVGQISDVIKAIELAVDVYNCQIINLSLGYYKVDNKPDDSLLQTKIDSYIAQGILIVAASGNFAEDKNPIVHPAAFSNVISVGAVNNDYTIKKLSTYNDFVDCSAPGIVVSKVYNQNKLEAYTGTSFAAPAVAAAAALMIEESRAHDISLTPEGFNALLSEKCMDLGANGKDPYYGYGFVRVDWLLSTDELMYDVIAADNRVTYTGITSQYGGVSNIVTASYSETGRLLGTEFIPLGSFCRTYDAAQAVAGVKYFYFDNEFRLIKSTIVNVIN